MALRKHCHDVKLIDILNAPWAIQPGKLAEIQAIYATHLRGEKIDIAGLEARLGRPLANEPRPYDVVDGVAVLAIEGVVAKRMNLFTQISGGTSSELVARDLQAALADEAVHSIVLAIDSPGGTVDGTELLANQVFAARDRKPVVALANGVMASAAYWIGSAAARVYVADGTTIVGSIGVVAKHVDLSASEAQQGVKTTEISAGRYKRIASQYEPLTEEGRASIQAQVDYTYARFVDAVAAQRGVAVDVVLSDMADGRLFIGQQAVDAGLVDGVSTLSALVAQLAADHRAGAARTTQHATTGAIDMTITRDQLAAEAPELLQSIQVEAAAAERTRIQEVLATALSGHEALVRGLAFDGRTTAAQAAMAVLDAERELRGAAAADLAADAPAPAKPAAAAAVEKPAGAEDTTLPLDERAKAAWEGSEKLRAEFGDDFPAYLAIRRAEAGGRVRVLGKQRAA